MSAAQPAAIDWLARAASMRELLLTASPEIDRLSQLTPEVVAALHKAELYRMLLPRSLGGGEVAPLVFVQAIEKLAQADASSAWCVAQSCGCSLSAAYLDPVIAREIFAPRDAVLCWGPLPRSARAIRSEGGYLISGSWLFASGGRHATWLGAHCALCDSASEPLLGEDGRPLDRTFLIPRREVSMKDVWRVMGLRGTGSDSYALADKFVRSEYSFARDGDDDRREKGPLYRFPFLNVFGIAFAAICFGIAQAMLDAFVELAPGKTPQGAAQSLRESARVQAQLATEEAKLRSARVYLHDTLDRLYIAARTRPFTIEERIDLRLCATAGMRAARQVATWTYQTAGATAIFQDGPFERRFRDIHTACQQVQAHESNLELVGRALMGLPAGRRL